MGKAAEGRYFEDFELGETIAHATPRTVSEGDVALYLALTGSRFLLHCDNDFARRVGLPQAPLADLLTFHIIFGKTVPDISQNAIANLGYAEGRFLDFVMPGERLSAHSEVIGLRETSNRDAGIVWVRTRGFADGRPVLEYVRWVLVRKRHAGATARAPSVPALQPFVPASELILPPRLGRLTVDPRETGSPWFFEDYTVGERIDHMDGMAVMESEHRLATRLYQNTARVHFNDHVERAGRLGRCIVYGGVVMSIARALSFNGLGNVLHMLAINAGTHANPCVAGDTIYAWSEVLDKASFPGRDDVGALRLRLVAVKNQPASSFPLRDAEGRYDPAVLLDLDWWGLVPRRRADTRFG